MAIRGEKRDLSKILYPTSIFNKARHFYGVSATMYLLTKYLWATDEAERRVKDEREHNLLTKHWLHIRTTICLHIVKVWISKCHQIDSRLNSN